MASVRGTFAIPEGEHRIPATPFEDIDKALAELRSNAEAWVALDVAARIALVEQMLRDTHAVADEWAATHLEAARMTVDHPQAGEGWAHGPLLLVRHLRLLRRTLTDILEHGSPQPPGPVRRGPDGQLVVRVMPSDLVERTVYGDYPAEIWLEPGVTESGLASHMAAIYQPGHRSQPRIALVLGAGNIAAIPANDTLGKMFAEDQVVLLKMNPVNEWVGPCLTRALRALVDAGFLRMVYGGVKEGAYLTGHEEVDTIHITGSDKTHDAVVFGTGEEAVRRKQRREPLLDKEVTSELGNVSPVIVVPGPWSESDLTFHGQNIASMLANNAGFNCIAARVLVLHGAWASRRRLLDRVRDTLRELPPRYPYYPGAVERFRSFVEAHPEAERYGPQGDDQVPWTLIPSLDRHDPDDIAFTTEAFCGVFGAVELDAPRSIPAYLEQAVAFCNERLWGTLAATIVIHPRSLRDPEVAAALERAIADLRYGTIVLNHFLGVGYGAITTPWGAAPGSELHDIQSGRGWVHNTYLFDRPQKAVVRGKFRPLAKPPWFVTHRYAREAFQAWVDLEADPTPANVGRFAWYAARG